MKILMAAAVPARREGGVAKIVHSLAREMQERGHTVKCIFVEDLGNFSGVPRRFTDAAFAMRLARFIRRNRGQFDVVNLHAPWGYAYGYLRHLTLRHGLPPYVMTMQCAEERYAYAMRREDEKGLADHFSWKNRVWHRLYHLTMYHRSILSADYCIVANREAAEYLQLHHKLDAELVWYIPNGVDNIFFRERHFAAAPRKLLFVGTWLDRKGVHYLVQAFQRLAASHSDVQLTIAGCMIGESAVRDAFAPEFRARVGVMPFVPAEQMPEVYAAHDIFVFPSLVEGMPLSLLEAMASGMAVVTTEIPGMVDMVEDNRNGLLVRPADVVGLAEAVMRLLKSPELCAGLGHEAQQSMRRYTWDVVSRKVEDVLALAISEKRIEKEDHESENGPRSGD